MTSLAARSEQDELMDGASISSEEFDACLVDLERLNRWSFAYRPTLAWLSRLDLPRGRTMSVLDVGCGRGDMLRQIEAWGRRNGVTFALTGVDLSPHARAAALRATPPDSAIRYVTADVFDVLGVQRFDLIVSSLFCHHLRDEPLARFIRAMDENTDIGWFINDLHRHPVPFHFLRALFAVLPFNRLVRHDGPVSVARAFVREDWRRLLDAAALDPARVEVRWEFPFRWGVAGGRAA